MIHLWGYIYSFVGVYQGTKVLPSSVTNALGLSNVREEESLRFNDANSTLSFFGMGRRSSSAHLLIHQLSTIVLGPRPHSYPTGRPLVGHAGLSKLLMLPQLDQSLQLPHTRQEWVCQYRRLWQM